MRSPEAVDFKKRPEVYLNASQIKPARSAIRAAVLLPENNDATQHLFKRLSINKRHNSHSDPFSSGMWATLPNHCEINIMS